MSDHYKNLAIQASQAQTNSNKQANGQHIAEMLGFCPGPRGKDGGIDGICYEKQNLTAYFQSKIESTPCSVEQAKIAFADIVRIKPKYFVYYSVGGYVSEFSSYLQKILSMQKISTEVILLDHTDIQNNSDKFHKVKLITHGKDSCEEINWNMIKSNLFNI